MFLHLLSFFQNLAAGMPLEWFVFLGSITEEVIAPIPSFVVMAVAGMVAATRGYTLPSLFLLAFLGSLGKTIGAWVLYVIGDKLEDLVLGHWGKKLGLSHKAVEHLGDRLGKGWKDDVLLFFLRAIPAIPSAPISILCGVIRIRLHTFIAVTFLGCFVRDLSFVLVGFYGTDVIIGMMRGLETAETVLTLVMVLLIAALVAWCYVRRSRGLPLPFLGSLSNGTNGNVQKQ
ncbi:MAG TPA: VTT domain-containing protein [Candidatus Peribacterales bacterium]|nr:VTT domain-containing protein [Candidatus Peribacterales bacterium]